MPELVKELENRAKEDANKKAKEYVVNAIQKCAVDHVPRQRFLWYSFQVMK